MGSGAEGGYAPAPTEPATNGGDPLEASTVSAVVGVPAGDTPRVAGVEELRFIKLSEHATMPTRAHDNDAGLDLYAAEKARIVPGARVSVGTGIAVAIPEGLAGLIMPRSGLALKAGVTLLNSPGVIDPGYRGEVRILLVNHDQTIDFHVKPGDRIAQLLLVPVATASPQETESLDSSSRGDGGFGSSGV